jgi:hypothetical protein
MPDRRSAHPWLAAATLRRIVALALTRTSRYELRPIAATGLVAAVPNEHADHRPGI